MKTKELIKTLTDIVEEYGDQDVAISTDEGTFPAELCYYDAVAESIMIAE